MMQWAWIIPILPLASFITILLVGRICKEKSSYIGITAMSISFLMSIRVLFEKINESAYYGKWEFLTIGENTIYFGYETTSLNVLMLVIVSFVSLLVHIYSRAYMHNDKRFPVFYAYLGLFTFAMLGLVLSSNLLQVYVFWELVGVGSFLLIGFYFYKEEAKKAAKKAFMITRIADMGLLLGILLVFKEVGSFEYVAIFEAVSHGELSNGIITAIAILIFIGAMGKSGQFPFHSWLPDAMEGPTPVSALIHAATMVAAGVYLVAATYPIFEASTTALLVVATVGGITAIFAATIGCVQTDIKRVLAYSTVSQLGYMMLSLGVLGYTAGVFHLTTHAFFKALLFLAAGSVIHAVHTQDIEKMGGLWKKLKYTAPFFLIGTLAISGVPLLSGFFSKDEILISVWTEGHYVLFIIAVLTAFLTAFYMFRLFFLVFAGSYRGEEKHIHESPKSMLIPMGILSVLAIFAGYINTPYFGTFLADFLYADHGHTHHAEHGPVWIMILAIAVSLLGILAAYAVYVRQIVSRDKMAKQASVIHTLFLNKYYIDELYDYCLVKPVFAIGHVSKWIEENIISGIVAGIQGTVLYASKSFRKIQDGQMQTSVAVAVIGLAILVLIMTITGGYWS